MRMGLIKAEIGAGSTDEGEIIFPPTPPYIALRILAHEEGHILAKHIDVSLTSEKVLTPEEVMRTRIELTTKEQLFLFLSILWNVNVVIPDWVIELTDRLLICYSKGNFNFEEIKIYPLSYKELVDVVHQMEKITVTVDEQGMVKPLSSREGRNEEFPAMMTDRAVLEILKNSCPVLLRVLLKVYEKINQGLVVPNSSHGRARKIVNRAYSKRNSNDH